MNTIKNIDKTSRQVNKTNIILDEQINLDIIDILSAEYIIEKHIPEEVSIDFLEELKNVANDWFWINMDLEDIRNHIYKSDEIFILKINWEIVWFSSLVNLKDFTYRFWTVIRKKFQAQWLYKKLSHTILEKDRQYFLRTQNKNIIKSLQKSFDNVIYWKEALLFMNNSLDNEHITDFMMTHWDHDKTLNENWIFKWAYPSWKMWEQSRVNYIDSEFYEDFDSDNGDSLLVVYYNN